jgi:hypothetical protein
MNFPPGWHSPEQAKKWESRLFWIGISLFMADAICGFAGRMGAVIGAPCFLSAIFVEIISRRYVSRRDELIEIREKEAAAERVRLEKATEQMHKAELETLRATLAEKITSAQASADHAAGAARKANQFIEGIAIVGL